MPYAMIKTALFFFLCISNSLFSHFGTPKLHLPAVCFSLSAETHKPGLSSASQASMLDKQDWNHESTETGNTPTELQPEPYAPYSGSFMWFYVVYHIEVATQ